MVVDQVGCPTYGADLAAMLARLCVERRGGLYHVTNAGTCSSFALARDVLELAGLDPSLIRPARTSDLPAAAPRPANSALDNAALRLSGLPLLRPYRAALAERLGVAD